jgi:hypothetical protein
MQTYLWQAQVRAHADDLERCARARRLASARERAHRDGFAGPCRSRLLRLARHGSGIGFDHKALRATLPSR